MCVNKMEGPPHSVFEHDLVTRPGLEKFHASARMRSACSSCKREDKCHAGKREGLARYGCV
jgi:hypothetical protein